MTLPISTAASPTQPLINGQRRWTLIAVLASVARSGTVTATA